VPGGGGPPPRAVFCAPLYGNAGRLAATLESLLSQTREDLALVLVDDCSPDETVAVARSFAEHDRRVSLWRNPRRVGMLQNTRRAHLLARRLHPDAPYLAYASDHDLWHPEWLERLVAPLEERPEVVLSHPRVTLLDERGGLVPSRARDFDTRGLDRSARFRAVHRKMVAGDMVYGLFRAAALDRVGPYRRVLLPDRLLLSELALLGEFEQVTELLWTRRLPRTMTLARQRAAFFPDRFVPDAYLPWWAAHAGALVWRYGVRGVGRPEVRRGATPVLAAQYLARPLARTPVLRPLRDARKARRRRRQEARRAARRAERRLRRRREG
jgi:glycosyltransferase involved in cell wall biosynthesis